MDFWTIFICICLGIWIGISCCGKSRGKVHYFQYAVKFDSLIYTHENGQIRAWDSLTDYLHSKIDPAHLLDNTDVTHRYPILHNPGVMLWNELSNEHPEVVGSTMDQLHGQFEIHLSYADFMMHSAILSSGLRIDYDMLYIYVEHSDHLHRLRNIVSGRANPNRSKYRIPVAYLKPGQGNKGEQ